MALSLVASPMMVGMCTERINVHRKDQKSDEDNDSLDVLRVSLAMFFSDIDW
jgi:hypothetical protein